MSWRSSQALSPSLLKNGAQVYRLVRIDFAGKNFFFADATVDITTESGVSLPHSGDAEIGDVATVLPGVGELSEPISLSCSVRDEVLQQLVAIGHRLSSGEGEVSLWVEGTTYETRVVILRGSLSSSVFDGVGDAISIAIEGGAWDTSAQTHDSSWTISPSTWSGYSSDVAGRAYPIVFGSPLRYQSAGSLISSYGSIAQSVDGGDTLLLCYGHAPDGSEIVGLLAEDGVFEPGGTVTLSVDSLGVPVTLFDISGAVSSIQDGPDIFVSWGASGTQAWGMPSPISTRRDWTATDLVAWMLGRTSHGCDLSRTVGVLDDYKVAGFLDESVGVLDWLSAQVLSILPVSLIVGVDGAYPYLHPWGDCSHRVVEHLFVGEGGVSRLSPLETTSDPADVMNSISLQYAWKTSSRSFARTQTCRGSGSVSGGSQYSQTARLAASLASYGLRSAVVESVIIQDETTAGLVLQGLAWRRSLPAREVSISVPWTYGWLSLGAVVTLSDDELGLSSAQCVIKGISYSILGLTLRLSLI